MTHPAISNSYLELEEHAKQFFAQQLNKPRRKSVDGMYVTKLPQPKTVLIKLFDHLFKIFLFWAKNQLGLSNDETYNDILNSENLTSLIYSLFRKLKSKKAQRK